MPFIGISIAIAIAALIVTLMKYRARLGLDPGHFVTIITAFASVCAVIAGWWFTADHDEQNRQRTTRINYLVEAYDSLADYANRCPSDERAHMAEIAVAKIELFGRIDEINELDKFLVEFRKQNFADLDGLLNLLRNSLRRELNLERVTGNVSWLRVSGGAERPTDCSTMPRK